MSSRAIQKMRAESESTNRDFDYSGFSEIDGTHPFQEAVPDGYITYRVRRRKNGRVAYFNFDLAKEMGLIPKLHPHHINRNLEKEVLDAFSLQIINEYDLLHGLKVRSSEIKPNRYMATRYLQLQHPCKIGKTSGDGRSIWNGTFTRNGTTWDVSSCGTGATRLSPATAINRKLYQSGDPSISYGCGFAELGDGLANAVFSEILHRNGAPTERTLAVLEYPGGLSINVRAGQNLLRPSHMFMHLKQGNYKSLKGSVDLFIERQMKNGFLKKGRKGKYKTFLDHISDLFAQSTAMFERDYIFCWLDWDGDNVLANGGIIDYGSIRQFGLFHHEYRFDDDDRWSTNIKEQRLKARYTVQTFAQVVDFLLTRKKKPVSMFKKASILKRFDREFELERRRLMLQKLGYSDKEIQFLMKKHPKMVAKFEDEYSYIERAKSKQGPIKVGDGVSWNAIFSVRDLLRELPGRLLEQDELSPEEIIDIIATDFATRKDLRINMARRKHFLDFQRLYLKLANKAARYGKKDLEDVLIKLESRSNVINRYERVTGDAMSFIGDILLANSRKKTGSELTALAEAFIKEQDLVPEMSKKSRRYGLRTSARRTLRTMLRVVADYRNGL